MELPKIFLRFGLDAECVEYKPDSSKETPEQKRYRILLEETHKSCNWVQLMDKFAQNGLWNNQFGDVFHSFWIEKGHFIRAKLSDDTILLEVLRAFLPPYKGEGMWLYRGENLDRFLKGEIGFCWTAEEEIAKGFARGFNAYNSGGVLLYAWAPATAILAKANALSQYLDENEITVDGLAVENLLEIERFPTLYSE